MKTKIGKVLRKGLWVLVVLVAYLLIVLLIWLFTNWDVGDVFLLVTTITVPLGVIVGLFWWAIKYKEKAIRKVEFIIGLLVIFGVIFIHLKLTGGVALTGITLSIFSIFYFVFSFALFNGIGFLGIFKKSSYKSINALEIIVTYLLGVSIAIILSGVMFHLLLYPGGKNAILAGLLPMGLITIITTILYFRYKINFYKRIFKRIIIYGGIGLLFYLTSFNTMIDFIYRPKFAELKKRERANPYDLEIQEEIRLFRYQEMVYPGRIYVFLKQEEIDSWPSRPDSYDSDYYMLGDRRIGVYDKIENLEIIGTDINDLTNFSSLSGLTSLRSLKINNTSLTNLKGLENVTSIGSLQIVDNELLTDCEIQGICDLIVGSPESIIIQNNATGCRSLEEVRSACGF